MRGLLPLPGTRSCASGKSRSSRFRSLTSCDRRPSKSIKPTMAKSREVWKLDQNRATSSTDNGTMVRLGSLTRSRLRRLRSRPGPSLKALIVAGEQCDAAALEPWRTTPVIINAYGPTETGIFSSMLRLGSGDTPISIGRPLPAVGFSIVDPWGQPTPIGYPGELIIGGVGVARGYV